MIACKICGKKYKRVCAHVRQAHSMSAREYKEKFGLDVKRGILSPEDRTNMRHKTLSNGTANNLLKHGHASRFKPGQAGLGRYKRSAQSIERLTKQIRGKGAPFKKGENQHTRRAQHV